jgi:ribonuclease E
MEAAFIDIGKGRNAVLYAGEVNWDALGAKDGGQRKIEQVLKPGQAVLVQVTKDPVGHKGARLTSQISIPGSSPPRPASSCARPPRAPRRRSCAVTSSG